MTQLAGLKGDYTPAQRTPVLTSYERTSPLSLSLSIFFHNSAKITSAVRPQPADHKQPDEALRPHTLGQ